jgi:hypothetical protein
VFRDLKQVQNAKESRLACQFRSNIWKSYWLDRIDLNLAFLHTIPRTYSDLETAPDSHTASDFSATYSLAKPFSERHEESLRPMLECGQLAKRCDTVKYREAWDPTIMWWFVNKGAKPEPLPTATLSSSAA